jgi:hypothetical protein
MPSAAPRYDARILDAIRRLDDRRHPIAETCRRVGTFAEGAGLTRPSYVHVRRIVIVQRERAREVGEARAALVAGLLAGLGPIAASHGGRRRTERR